MDRDFQNWPSRRVTREEMGEDWPLSVDAATLYYNFPCLVVEVGGVWYAGNGSAKGGLQMTSLDDIWASHPDWPRKDIGKFIELGLAIGNAG